VRDGKLEIRRDGRARKFVDEVEHRTYSGRYAAARKQTALYITERCVFRLTAEGLELVEIAPGVDLQRDILEKMAVQPVVRAPRTMDSRLFRPQPMGLREDLLRLPFDARFQYDAEQNALFLNFEKFEIRTMADIEAIRNKVRELCEPLGHKVYTVVNYDGFVLPPELENAYAGMVVDVQRYYLGITRYTTSSFLRAKLGDALSRRGLPPYLYESGEEAAAHVREQAP
ncbi:MAG: acyl CoA:acetate/3-ketoacid CoA transferase, partial [Gammaproteobacteria bacterium]